MKKFIVLYRAPVGSWDVKGGSPEEHKKEMDKWMKWAKASGKGLVDMGAPLGNSKKVTSLGAKSVKSNILGYSVLQARDMNGALKLLKKHPHLMWKKTCVIEVYEMMEMGR